MPAESRLATHRVTTTPGDSVILAITGELDMSNAPKLREWIGEAAATPATNVDIDLGGVTFLDSTTIKTLVEMQRQLRDAGTRMSISHMTGHVARVLRTTGVLTALTRAGTTPAR